MDRSEAYNLVKDLIKNQNLIKHHLAAEAAMKGLAEYFKEKGEDINVEDWALAGLLHDADYELTKNDPENHTRVLEEKIENAVKPEIMHAIKAHAYKFNSNAVEPKNFMDWSMYTCDELTGFIIAVALVKPEKKLSSVDVESVLKRMKEPAFARAVDRDQIKLCEEKLGISLPEFIRIVLTSMQKISDNLGL